MWPSSVNGFLWFTVLRVGPRVPLRCRLMQSNSPHGLPPAEFAKNTSAKEYNRIHAWDYEPFKHRDVP